MSDLLSIGASGVRAYQTALNTVSENIANTGTAGYTRRTTNLGQVTSIGSGINASVATGSNGVTADVVPVRCTTNPTAPSSFFR